MFEIASESAPRGALALFVAQDEDIQPNLVGVDMNAYMADVGFKAKAGEVVSTIDGDRTVFVAGLGSEGGPEGVRRAAGALGKRIGLVQELTVAVDDAFSAEVVEGLMLGMYAFDTYRSESKPSALSRVVFLDASADAIAAAERGRVRAASATWARDLVNTPARDQSPEVLADEIRDRLEGLTGVSVEVHDEHTISAMALGGLEGVAAGSHRPARVVVADYSGGEDVPLVVLVGKGITFDSGGLSLKSAQYMEQMKTDMAGAATVMATIEGAARLGIPLRLRAIALITDNMPGGSALRPGDVITPRNGTTVEVLNTDAEGRLVLADGLSLGAEADPTLMLDVATLTGAAKVALGTTIGAFFASEESLVAGFRQAAEASGEPFWPMPLPTDYRANLDSDIADIKNVAGRWGGAITAALFLKEFVGDTPWIHLDIAGPGRSEESQHYLTKGGTGFGVRTLLEYLTAFTSA